MAMTRNAAQLKMVQCSLQRLDNLLYLTSAFASRWLAHVYYFHCSLQSNHTFVSQAWFAVQENWNFALHVVGVVLTFCWNDLMSHSSRKDVCHTALFSQCWFCANCGRELCGDCVSSLTEVRLV